MLFATTVWLLGVWGVGATAGGQLGRGSGVVAQDRAGHERAELAVPAAPKPPTRRAYRWADGELTLVEPDEGAAATSRAPITSARTFVVRGDEVTEQASDAPSAPRFVVVPPRPPSTPTPNARPAAPSGDEELDVRARWSSALADPEASRAAAQREWERARRVADERLREAHERIERALRDSAPARERVLQQAEELRRKAERAARDAEPTIRRYQEQAAELSDRALRAAREAEQALRREWSRDDRPAERAAGEPARTRRELELEERVRQLERRLQQVEGRAAPLPAEPSSGARDARGQGGGAGVWVRARDAEARGVESAPRAVRASGASDGSSARSDTVRVRAVDPRSVGGTDRSGGIDVVRADEAGWVLRLAPSVEVAPAPGEHDDEARLELERAALRRADPGRGARDRAGLSPLETAKALEAGPRAAGAGTLEPRSSGGIRAADATTLGPEFEELRAEVEALRAALRELRARVSSGELR